MNVLVRYLTQVTSPEDQSSFLVVQLEKWQNVICFIFICIKQIFHIFVPRKPCGELLLLVVLRASVLETYFCLSCLLFSQQCDLCVGIYCCILCVSSCYKLKILSQNIYICCTQIWSSLSDFISEMRERASFSICFYTSLMSVWMKPGLTGNGTLGGCIGIPLHLCFSLVRTSWPSMFNGSWKYHMYSCNLHTFYLKVMSEIYS